MSTNGHLKFQGTNRATFVGETSNIMFDTTTTSLGIGVTGTDHPSSNLYITGNAYISNSISVGGVLTMGTVNVVARHDLEAVTAMGNTTPLTIEFSNATTGIVTTGNVEVGDELTVSGNTETKNINMLHTANTASIKLNSNVVTEFPRSKKLIKYPRVALTGPVTSGYVVTASSTLSTGSPANVPYTVFDESLTSFWHTQYPYYNTSNGSYAPGQTALGTGTPANGTTLPTNELVSGHQGEWISLELPNKIKLDRLKVTGSTRLASGVTQFPKDVVVAVSDTGLSGSWSVLQTATLTSQNVSNHSVTINITTDASYYKYFALIVKSINSTATYSATEIGQLELYGLPEYDPEVAGLDVKVTSYPNVPNTDWLEVYYDAKGLSTMPSIVTDLSPNSNDGLLSDSPQVSNEAFVFDGVNDYIYNSQTGYTGGDRYTASAWIKKTANINGCVFQFGNGSNGNSIGIFYYGGTLDYIRAYVFGYAIANSRSSSIPLNEWIHVTGVYSDKTATLYINGIEVATGTGSTGITIPSTPYLTIGAQTNNINNPYTATYFTGSIANFRLFNRALSQDEIYQLYAYQKEYFGHGDLSMTLKAGRLGIGTSEPRAALDVRGDIVGGCPVYFSARTAAARLAAYAGNVIVFEIIDVSYGGGYDKSNGKFTAPLSGAYKFTYHVRGNTSGGNMKVRPQINGVNPGTNTLTSGSVYVYGDGYMAHGSTIVNLKAGETFELLLFSHTTGSQPTMSSDYNGFTGEYISSI